MMMPFIKTDDLYQIKNNISSFSDHFAEDDNSWIAQEIGHDVFTPSKFQMPNITLNVSELEPSDSDAVNVTMFYDKFRFLSDAQASDERVWAALCLGPFWNYVQYRWKVKKNHSRENILQHYFFAFGARRSLTRNALSRLWWTARLTCDLNASNPYELTDYVSKNSRFIVDVLERNTSNNPEVLRPFLRGVMDAEREGISITSERMRILEIYLDELGGIYILDCLPEQKIHDKVLGKAEDLWKTDPSDKTAVS